MISGPLTPEAVAKAKEIWGNGEEFYKAAEILAKNEIECRGFPPETGGRSLAEFLSANESIQKRIQKSENAEVLSEKMSKPDMDEEIGKLLSKYYEGDFIKKLLNIRALALEAIVANKLMADKTASTVDPAGYCPPDKREKIIGILKQIFRETL